MAEALAAVLNGTPDWDAIPDTTPFLITRLVRRCLARDRRERIPDAGAARLEIADALTTPVGESTAEHMVPQLQIWQRAVPAAIAAAALVLGGLIVGSVAFSSRAPAESPPIVRMPIALGTEESFTTRNNHVMAISPDGRHIVYSANGSLWLRPVDQLEATPIAGTNENARIPVFSPDGQWIAYRAGESRQLKRIPISGGAPVVVGDARGAWGASWGADDTILFGLGEDGIWQVPGMGGTPVQLIALEDGWRATGPQMLPGGEWVLFTLRGNSSPWSEAQIVVQSVVTGDRQVLIDGGHDARYVPTGHLVYALNGVIVAVPFDAGARTVTGGAVPLVEGVRSTGPGATGAAFFSLSSTGSLVYIPGGAEMEADGEGGELVWVDRSGQVQPVGAEPRPYGWARISPDGTRVAVDTRGDANNDVWVYDLVRGTLTRLTFDEAPDAHPLWTPDGLRVVFGSGRQGGGLFSKAADGTGDVEQLLESQDPARPQAWLADGRLLFDQIEGIGLLEVEGERTTEFLFDTDYGRLGPALSPDRRWLAYGSNESGRVQVYVRPFPNVDDGRWLVSVDGGYFPVWAPDGRELFFLSQGRGGGELMVAQVETEPTFTAQAPERLFSSPDLRGGVGRVYDIAPDGDRFIFLKREAEQVFEEEDGLVYVQNWLEELKARVPVN